MYIYMAGALTYYHNNNEIEKGLTWRNKLDEWARDNGIKTFNPALTFMIEQNHSYSPSMCVAQNDYYINKCDICIVNLDDIDYSPGTIYELTRFKELRKPVISFGRKSWSPHINYCVSNHCETLDEVIELLINMFGQSF